MSDFHYSRTVRCAYEHGGPGFEAEVRGTHSDHVKPVAAALAAAVMIPGATVQIVDSHTGGVLVEITGGRP